MSNPFLGVPLPLQTQTAETSANPCKDRPSVDAEEYSDQEQAPSALCLGEESVDLRIHPTSSIDSLPHAQSISSCIFPHLFSFSLLELFVSLFDFTHPVKASARDVNALRPARM